MSAIFCSIGFKIDHIRIHPVSEATAISFAPRNLWAYIVTHIGLSADMFVGAVSVTGFGVNAEGYISPAFRVATWLPSNVTLVLSSEAITLYGYPRGNSERAQNQNSFPRY